MSKVNLSPKAEVAKKPPKQTRITDWKSNPDIDEPMKYNADVTEDRTKVEVLEVRDGLGKTQTFCFCMRLSFRV